jgi:catechol 2,3-dioxygenase-like lactoylglutathione lyase family enzyme
MMSTFAKTVALLLTLGVMNADAAPVADEDRVPIDLRRTTLVVEDIENSLAFYRDALGLEVIYDNLIRTPRDAGTDEEADRSLRLVFLRSNDDYVGIIGLLQYRKPARPAPDQAPSPFSTGSIVLLFNATDLDSTFAKARTVPGVTILNEPRLTQYPSYDGEGTISVNVSVLTDPDGFVVELNQLLESLH